LISAKRRWPEIIPEGENSLFLFLSCLLILALITLSSVLIGAKTLAVIGLLLLVYVGFRYKKPLIFIFLGIAPITTFMFWDYKTYLNYSYAMLIILFWITRKLIVPKERIEISRPLMVFAAAFMFFAILSDLNGGVNTREIAALIRFVFFFTYVMIFYDVFEMKDMMWVMAAIVSPLILELFYVLPAYANASGLFDALLLYRLKPTGYFDNANVYGGVLICVTPFWAALALWSKRKKIKYISAFLAVLLLLGLILSNARAAIFGALIVTILFSIWGKKVRYLVTGALILGIVFLSLPMLQALVKIGLRTEYGTTNRTEIWANTLIMISKHPILGVGLGNYSHEYMPYFPTVGMRNFFKALSHAHNQILAKTAELGIFGLFLMMYLYYFPAKTGFKVLTQIRGYENRLFIYGIVGGIIGMYGRTVFETGIIDEGSFYPDIIFWVLVAMVLKIHISLKRDPTASFP